MNYLIRLLLLIHSFGPIQRCIQPFLNIIAVCIPSKAGSYHFIEFWIFILLFYTINDWKSPIIHHYGYSFTILLCIFYRKLAEFRIIAHYIEGNRVWIKFFVIFQC